MQLYFHFFFHLVVLYMKKVLANPETGYSPMEEFDIPEDFNPNAGCQ